MEARSPATPAPITMKSAWEGIGFICGRCKANVTMRKAYGMRVQPQRICHASREKRTRLNRVPVTTSSRTYDVLIGHEILREAGKHIRTVLPKAQRAFVVTSPPVRKHWAG